jgi:hypothetical protein
MTNSTYVVIIYTKYIILTTGGLGHPAPTDVCRRGWNDGERKAAAIIVVAAATRKPIRRDTTTYYDSRQPTEERHDCCAHRPLHPRASGALDSGSSGRVAQRGKFDVPGCVRCLRKQSPALAAPAPPADFGAAPPLLKDPADAVHSLRTECLGHGCTHRAGQHLW